MPSNEHDLDQEYVPFVVIGMLGIIQRTGFCKLSMLHAQAQENEIALILTDPDVSDDTHFWNMERFEELPPKPGEWAIWNGTEWTDPRPPTDPVAELAALRAAASLSRADFIIAAVGAGIIAPADAGPAARGEVPASMQAVLSHLPEAMQVEAAVRWGASTIIERTNSVLAAIAAEMGVTDEQLDALFGIVPPET